MGKNHPSVRSDMRYNQRQEDIILVAHGIYCSLKANNRCFGVHPYASKHHDRATYKGFSFNHTVFIKLFTTRTVHSASAIISTKQDSGFIKEQNICPVCHCVPNVTPCPRQSCYPVSLMKHNPSSWSTAGQASRAKTISESLGTSLAIVSTNDTPCSTSGCGKSCSSMWPNDVSVLSLAFWPDVVDQQRSLLAWILLTASGYTIDFG